MALDAEFRAETPLTVSRIGVAVLLGAGAASVVIALMLALLQGLPHGPEWVNLLPAMLTGLPFMALALAIFFGAPVMIYGAVLLRLRVATPLRITLPPGILYAIIAVLIGAGGSSPELPLAIVPAVTAGGLTAYVYLARRMRTELPAESVF